MVPTLPSSPAGLTLVHCATLWSLYGYAHAIKNESESTWSVFTLLLSEEEAEGWDSSEELKTETKAWFAAARAAGHTLLTTMHALYIECANRNTLAAFGRAIQKYHDPHQQYGAYSS